MGKRTKQYKKLMRSFELLGFRQPYQLLITSDVVLDTLKLDLVGLFEKTLSTRGVKPMITQCCIVCCLSLLILLYVIGGVLDVILDWLGWRGMSFWGPRSYHLFVLDMMKMKRMRRTLKKKKKTGRGYVLTVLQRALYAKNTGPNRDPAVAGAIERAKTFERRRCGHLMDADPLAERECMLSVVDPKGKGENKFRYVVVTQDEELVCLFFFLFSSVFLACCLLGGFKRAFLFG